MSREQRTRLNAELAHQYGYAETPSAATPGRSSRTGELVDEQQELPNEHEAAPAERAEHEEAQPRQAAEPQRSLFELPRKAPARPPLVPGGSTTDAGGEPTES